MLEHLAEGGGEKMKGKKLGQLLRDDDRVPDEEQLRLIGRHCSTTERNSEQAERELRAYLVLELLQQPPRRGLCRDGDGRHRARACSCRSTGTSSTGSSARRTCRARRAAAAGRARLPGGRATGIN